MNRKYIPLFLVVSLLCASFVAAENTNGMNNVANMSNTTTNVTSGNSGANVTSAVPPTAIVNATAVLNSTKKQVNTKNQTRERNESAIKAINISNIRIKAKTVREYRQIIQERKQVMNQTLIGISARKIKIYKNQNQVREAVHNLLALEDLAGGIGKNISKIAREFNNSVQKTINAEEKIQNRAPLLRFFAGGNKKATEELEAELTQNRIRMEKLVQYRERLQPELKGLLNEQITQIQQEQTRLTELAQKEKKSKGIFGWLWK